MDALREYVQSDYLTDKKELLRVEELAKTIVEFLVRAFADGWPYQLAAGEPRPAAADSQSTDAMILFSLAAVTGRIPSSVLVPGIRSLPLLVTEEEGRRVDLVLEQGLGRLIKLSGALKTGGPVTTSGTYGPDDPFSLTWFFELLASSPRHVGRQQTDLRKASDRVAEASRRLVRRALRDPRAPILRFEDQNDEAVLHAFPLLRAAQLREALFRAGRMSRGVGRELFQVFDERLHLHLALSEVRDSAFDAGELVFALEGWLLSHVGSPDRSVVDRAFRILGERQSLDAYWRPLRPFKVTPQGLVLLPQSVEIANSMLRVCASLPAGNYFSDNLSLFKRYTSWLDSRRFKGQTSDGLAFVGWESEHTHVPARIHLWQTSQALLYLQHYASFLRQHIAETTISRAGVLVDEWVPKRDRLLDRH